MFKQEQESSNMAHAACNHDAVTLEDGNELSCGKFVMRSRMRSSMISLPSSCEIRAEILLPRPSGDEGRDSRVTLTDSDR